MSASHDRALQEFRLAARQLDVEEIVEILIDDLSGQQLVELRTLIVERV